MKNILWLALTFYLLAASVLVSTHAKESIGDQKTDENNSTETHGKEYTVDSETYEAIQGFLRSGMNIVEISQELKRLRDFTRKQSEQIRQLKDKVKFLEEVRENCNGTRQRGQTTWEWLWGIQPSTEETIVVLGSDNVWCCLSLTSELSLETFTQWLKLMEILFADPLSLTSNSDGGTSISSRLLGFVLSFVALNVSAYIYQELSWVCSKSYWFLTLPFKLPFFVVIKKVFKVILQRSQNLDAQTKSDDAPKEDKELTELKNELKKMAQDIKKQAQKSEVAEMRDILKQMMTQMATAASQRTNQQFSRPSSPRNLVRDQSPRQNRQQNTMLVWCPDCQKPYRGGCWRKPCEGCGKVGMCEHRMKTTWAYRQRQGQPQSEVMMSMMEQLAGKVSELERRDEDAQSSISLSPSEQQAQTPTVNTTNAQGSNSNGMYQVKGKLGGDQQMRTFLLDTAANCNVILLAVCQALGFLIRPSSTGTVVGVGNQSVKVIGEVVAHTYMGDECKELLFVVLEGNEKLIVGAPGLQAMGINIHCGDKSITMPSGNQLACLYLQKTNKLSHLGGR